MIPEMADQWADLTAADRTNLNVWGRAYNLQHDGFTRGEAAKLAFLSLLVDNGCYTDDRRPAPAAPHIIALGDVGSMTNGGFCWQCARELGADGRCARCATAWGEPDAESTEGGT